MQNYILSTKMSEFFLVRQLGYISEQNKVPCPHGAYILAGVLSNK